MVPLMALMLFMGLYPAPLISRLQPSVQRMLAGVQIEQVRLEQPTHREVAVVVPLNRPHNRALEPAAVQ